MLQFFITILILFSISLGLLLSHWLQPADRRQWLLALAGSLLALGSWLWMRTALPVVLIVPTEDLWRPSLQLGALGWAIGLGLLWLYLSTVLVSISGRTFPAPRRWAGLAALTLLGLLTLASPGPRTLAFLWVLLDLQESILLISAGQSGRQSEQAVIHLSGRLASVGLLVWGAVLQASGRPADTVLLLAALLRTGTFPFHLPMEGSGEQRQQVGAFLRVVTALSGLVLLLRVTFTEPSRLFLLLLTATALYSAIRWVQNQDALEGRPYWVISLSALAGAEALLGNHTAVAAIALVLIFGVGLFSLYTLRKQRHSRLLLGAGLIAFSTLPFTLATSIWTPPARGGWEFWLAGLPAYSLLLIGMARHLLRPSIIGLDHQPPPIRRIYLGGLYWLVGGALLLGLAGWPGAGNIGSILPALLNIALTLGGGYLIWRLRMVRRMMSLGFSPRQTAGWIFPLLWNGYRRLGRVIHTINQNWFESPSGLLWPWVFFLLILSYWIF